MVTLIYPSMGDKKRFLQAIRASKKLHAPWVTPPSSDSEFIYYLKKYDGKHNISHLLCVDKEIIGVVNINEIIRGCFQSGYLGYYGMAKYVGQGYMSQGFALVLEKAFIQYRLHRLEANIQPENQRSINLVKRHGFKQEGFSPRYLNINNQWEDHQRWALTFEDWQVAKQ